MADDLKQEVSTLRKENKLLADHLCQVEIKYQAKLAAVTEGKDEDDFTAKHLNFISGLFQNDNYSDMIILLEGGLHLKAHKFILSAQSDFWNSVDLQILDLTGIDYDVAFALIKWIYTDVIEIPGLKFLKSLSLLAVQFDLKALFKRCKTAEEYFPEFQDEDVDSVTEDLNQEEETILQIDQLPEETNGPNPDESALNICETCDKQFETSEEFKRHLKNHNKKHKCSQCDKAYKKPHELRKHIKASHEKVKEHKCNLCQKSFTIKSNLYAHERRHAGLHNFTCKFCGQLFKSKGNLDVHLRIHTGSKPYQCEFCDQAFSQLGNKKSHQRVHTGQRPYTCPECPQSFKSQTDLNRHKNIHLGFKQFACSYCDKTYSQKVNLDKHVYKHADEILTKEATPIQQSTNHNTPSIILSDQSTVNESDILQLNDPILELDQTDSDQIFISIQNIKDPSTTTMSLN